MRKISILLGTIILMNFACQHPQLSEVFTGNEYPDLKKELASGWNANRFIHENYNADNGEGTDVISSDNFYH